MECCDTQSKMLPFEQALHQLLSGVSPLQAEETVDLFNALDRTLTHAICSPCDVPPHDNSAMDGYALCATDLNASLPLKLIGKSFAGQPFQGTLRQGECVRIMTGALLPAGADTVIMQENTRVEGEFIHFLQSAKCGDNIRRAGEDIVKGDLVFEQGHTLRAADIGLLASLGIARVQVQRRVRVAIFATGDELVEPGEPLKVGQIYNSNRYVLYSMLQKLGVSVIDLGTVADDPTALRHTLQSAAQQADVVITSGGVSVGEADYIKPILQEMGQIDFWKVAIKPGKPFAFGRLQSAYFCGLPGNPVSALVTFYLLVKPLLQRLSGQAVSPLHQISAICETPLKKSVGRMDFQRGILWQDENGRYHVKSTGAQGSGILSSISQANCFIVLPAACGPVPAGVSVSVHPFADALI